jgi:DNA repair protein RecO (recombination protein O)
MKFFKEEGIVLNTKNFFEKDKLLTIFSPKSGKCRFLVKGANSKRFKNIGVLEVSNYISVVGSRGKSFSYVYQCDLISFFPNIRNDYEKIALLFYVFDIIGKTTLLDQNNRALFDLLKEVLTLLDEVDDLKSIRQFFYHGYLKREGLLDENQSTYISDGYFKKKFEEYTGCYLREL